MRDAATLSWPVLLQAGTDDALEPARRRAGPVTDEALMARVRGGDTDAFARLYQRWSGPLFNFLLRMTRQRPLAEDLLQESFTKVWRAAGTWNPDRGTARAWMYAIALNTARSELVRAVHRRPHTPLEPDSPPPERRADGEAQMTERLDAAARSRAVERALDELPSFLKEVVVLRCQQQLPFAEIARVCRTEIGRGGSPEAGSLASEGG